MEFQQQITSVHHQPPPSPTTTTISNENLLLLESDKINYNELGKPVSESNNLETQLEQPPLEDEIAPADVTDVEKPGGELTDSVAGADVADVEKSGGELTDSVAVSDVAGIEKDVDGSELPHSVAGDDVAGVEKHDGGDELMDSVAGDDVAAMEKQDGGDELMDSVKGDDLAGVEKQDGGDELTDSVAGDDVAGVEKHDEGNCDVLTDSVAVVGEHQEVMTDFENVEMEEGVGVREGVTENEEKEKMDRHVESDDDDADEVTMSDDDDDEEEEEEEKEKVERKTLVKRRGRPLGTKKRGGKTPKATPKSTGRVKIVKEEEEDVCFLCYDGGELVLCDMRNCPKAYHLSCINRDEAFFQTKGKWNCGWHLCTICMKKAEYMCYTCSFSLCKTCIKNNDILCIRQKEKKGFCTTCMKTIMAIEKHAQEDQENIDFDDKNSWEYLFKDYWLDKKSKLNISLDELVEAKNAWKEPDPTSKAEPPAGHSDGGSGSEHPSENLESQTTKTRRRKSKKQKTHDSAVIASEGTSVPKNSNWASKELLEFVMHMGCDKSSQSEFDVQALLLEYIKINKLRDARRKSQIICDSRLQRLFGKPRVGHFEMLKLLESHFLIKEDDDVKGNVVDTEGPADDDDTETVAKGSKDKKRKIRKKGDREPQSNREDFAAIDAHNINLIYLKRKLAEDLLDDVELFNSKVVGTFVRIRITGANQKHDLYRLVQVTGTTKGEPYEVGKKMTDTILEILNLNKKEYITIDTISNQDFMEDECRRLRQSIKCGLINRLTVGDVLDKAIELQATRVNDWLEGEVLRLSHLRDRASDLGRKKELRECVEKLQVLKTPEERTRRIQDIPVVHDDPTMAPNYESEDNADEDSKKQDIHKNTVSSSYSKRRDYPSKESGRGTGTSRSSGKNYELSRNLSSNKFLNKAEDVTSPRLTPHNENRWDQGRDRSAQPSSVVIPSSANEREKNVASTEDISESGPKVNETDKLWHYRDPTGKIQGPFSMAQLRKWNNSNFFPADLRIWRKSEKEDDGILLTGALEGQLHVMIPKPSSDDRHGFTNLPSPTPNQSLGHLGSPVGPKALVQTGHMVSTPVINMPPQMVQSHAAQNPHSWVGGPTHNPQPSPVAGQQLTYKQWVSGPNTAQNSAGNFLQQPLAPTQTTESWPIVSQNTSMGLAGTSTVSQSVNWGSPQLTVNVDPSWGLQSGSGSVHPGWAPTQPVQGVTPNQGWVTGASSGPTNGPIVSGNGNSSWVGPSFKPGEAASAGNQLPGSVGGPYQSSGSGNSNQGWGSPTSRNRSRWDGSERHQPYNRSGDSGDKRTRDSRGGSSDSRDNRRHYDESRSFNSRRHSRDSDRYYKR
uniref:zinc finger CCCH domain-containing protein 19-like n=1 Tax=Erigeron canadensis TaxID=72917 RepID=UPI001CB8DF67|nr:zinc finger CCCH domain-containing protein 19-like [Erigeron canadensis]